MNEPTAGSDPEQTREIPISPVAPPPRHAPSEGPTRFIPTPPPYRPPSGRPVVPPPPPPPPPTPRFRPPAGPPPRSPAPPPPAPPPAAPTAAGRNPRRPGREQTGEPPWWQTINRDRRPGYPAPPPPPRSPAPPPRPASPRPAPVPSTGKRAPAGWWIAAAVGAVVVIAGGAAALAGSGTKPPAMLLDVESAQRQVEQIVRDPLDGYGAGTVTGVVCNDGVNPVLEKGAEFICEAVVDGVSRRVAVVVQDDAGTFAVDRPR